MNELQSNEFSMDSSNLLKFIIKHYRPLVIISLLAAILSAAGSYLITPKFTSQATFYPVNITEYSEESEAEQALQIVQSLEIKEKLIEAFDLYDHYEIGKDDPLRKYYILNEMRSNINFNKTSYDAIQVKVMDEDPVQASNMVDSIVRYYNEKIRSMHRIKRKEMVVIMKNELKKTQQQIDSMHQVMVSIGNKEGMFDFELVNTEASNNNIQAQALQARKRLKALNDVPAEYQIANAKLLELLEYYANIKQIYDQNVMEFNKEITYSLMVNHPYPADKRSYPIRSLIVIISTISAFILVLVILLIINKLKKQSILR